jgi:N6-L-threonylcarbamoyladenine synthase
MAENVTILAIESSCDETSASVVQDGKVLSNVIATQEVHQKYGGVVPEMASRAHMQHIIPVVDTALKDAAVHKTALSAIAFTQAPGLIGSLLVGACFAKSYAQALNLPLITVHHMQAHVLAHFIDSNPPFPFLCLTVSGGHTQIVLCRDYLDMEVIGETIDDAAGEAFDKVAKMLGLPYPGGPVVDKLAAQGDPHRFKFPVSEMKDFNFSFSGVKTAILYFVQAQVKLDPDFIEKNKTDLCAAAQHTIISMLMKKLEKAALQLGIQHVGIAGGVSANKGLRAALQQAAQKNNWVVYLPKFEYCTDNAAMIGITAYHKYLKKDFAEFSVSPAARAKW